MRFGRTASPAHSRVGGNPAPTRRKRGTARHHHDDFVIQTTPFRIRSLDLPEFPQPIPFLRLSLALECRLARTMLLEPDQHLYAVCFGEPVCEPFAMLPHPAHQIVGHADVQRAVSLTSKNVDIEGHRPSLPRKRQIIDLLESLHWARRRWIPAFAGVSGGPCLPIPPIELDDLGRAAGQIPISAEAAKARLVRFGDDHIGPDPVLAVADNDVAL